MKKIGLALGSGGARGLAHILMFEVFEELGIMPSIISGSSIGAILGASFASGTPSKEIKEVVNDLIFHKNSKFWQIHKRSDYTKMLNYIDFGLKPGGIIKGEKFLKVLKDEIKVNTFEELKIPLKVVATDYWDHSAVVLEKGDLHKAVISSFSLPGLFPPVEIDDKLLIDGGMSNPLPYDLIQSDCDITIAIDVSAKKDKILNGPPPSYEVLFSAFQIMQNSVVTEKLKRTKPDIMINTEIKEIRVHEFMKADSIYKQACESKNNLKRILEKTLA
ncbi:MAG: patatin-like phospholipase family protein [Melioribacteraceae bacterium]|nr:patatin-like phospholipase family protein [Melioribacteraceae bacterium]